MSARCVHLSGRSTDERTSFILASFKQAAVSLSVHPAHLGCLPKRSGRAGSDLCPRHRTIAPSHPDKLGGPAQISLRGTALRSTPAPRPSQMLGTALFGVILGRPGRSFPWPCLLACTNPSSRFNKLINNPFFHCAPANFH